MLKFTLHRPTQDSEVCTCCHAMSCRGTSGRVHVSVGPVPARNAHESRLALTTLRSYVLAGLQGCAAESGHRHTSPDHAAARRWPSSRNTSSTRTNPPKKDFLPDPKDRVSALDHR